VRATVPPKNPSRGLLPSVNAYTPTSAAPPAAAAPSTSPRPAAATPRECPRCVPGVPTPGARDCVGRTGTTAERRGVERQRESGRGSADDARGAASAVMGDACVCCACMLASAAPFVCVACHLHPAKKLTAVSAFG
jgi:hypothetical protein